MTARRWIWLVATALVVTLAYGAGPQDGAPEAETGAHGPEAARPILVACAEPADPERAARVAVAQTSAAAAIAAGLADGVWTAEDREALRAQLPYLGQRETHAVLSPLFQAINAQRVQLDGPPI